MLNKVEYKYIVAMVGVFSIFMELLDTTIINVALPTLARRVRRHEPCDDAVGDHRLPAEPRGVHPGERLGGRPLRDEVRVHVRAGGVHRRVAAVRAGVEHRVADRVPRAAGRRRWHALAGRVRDGVARVSAGGAVEGGGHHGGAGGGRAGERAGRRRVPRRVRVVGVDLPRQHADRHRGAADHAFYLRTSNARPTPGRSTRAGFVLSASGLASSCTRSRRRANNGFSDPQAIAFWLGGLALHRRVRDRRAAHAQPMLDVRILKNPLFRACNLALARDDVRRLVGDLLADTASCRRRAGSRRWRRG